MRIVPSQVVAAISSLFGPQRHELSEGMIQFMHRDQVRTALSLLQQIPNELLTLSIVDYTDYLQCKSALTSALSTWDAQVQGPPARQVGGRDPIERIRRLLALCPDEKPAATRELAFISDEVARASVNEDIRAAWIDFQAEEWKGATVFAATAVEALLFWALKPRGDLRSPMKLDQQHLSDYIPEAERLGVIGKTTADQARLAKDVRNLIHAGKMARTGLNCTKATALVSLAALEAVLGDLT